jgi:uncharacterized protein YbjT (DUF2867 family)
MILVVGASGYVGRHVLARLAGEPARGLVRRRDRAGDLGPNVEVIEGDLTQPEGLAPALAGVRVVFHCAAITGDHKEPYRGAYDAVNRVGTRNLVAAAKEAGVERLVVMSGLGTHPAPTGTYMATRWGMEEAVRSSQLPFVILQPSVLFGKDAPFPVALARLIRSMPVVPVLGGDVRFQPLWIEDLVTCLLRAAQDTGLDGQAIPLGGAEQLTMRELLQEIAGVLGKHPHYVPLPLGVARLQARLMTAVMAQPSLTPAALELLGFDNTTDVEACKRAFGFQPQGFRAYLRQHGLAG